MRRREYQKSLDLLQQTSNDGKDLKKSRITKLIGNFGGVPRLVKALATIGYEIDPSAVYRWRYPRPKGTGGVIPNHMWGPLHAAARMEGISLNNQDLDPSDGEDPLPMPPALSTGKLWE